MSTGTTILVSRGGHVYDLGKTKTDDDGNIIPTEYPPWKGKGMTVIPENMAAFGMCCSQEYCDELKKLTPAQIRKRFDL